MAKAKGKAGAAKTGFGKSTATTKSTAATTKSTAATKSTAVAKSTAEAKSTAVAASKAKAAEMTKSFKALDNMMAGMINAKTPTASRGGWNLAGVQFSNGIALGVNTPDVARAIAVSRKEEAAKIQAALTIKEEKKKELNNYLGNYMYQGKPLTVDDSAMGAINTWQRAMQETPEQRATRPQSQQEYLNQRETQPLNAPRDEEGAFISWDGTTINSSWVERNSPQLSASKFVNQNFEATKRYEEQTKAIMGDNFGKPTTAQSHDLRTAAEQRGADSHTSWLKNFGLTPNTTAMSIEFSANKLDTGLLDNINESKLKNPKAFENTGSWSNTSTFNKTIANKNITPTVQPQQIKEIKKAEQQLAKATAALTATIYRNFSNINFSNPPSLSNLAYAESEVTKAKEKLDKVKAVKDLKPGEYILSDNNQNLYGITNIQNQQKAIDDYPDQGLVMFGPDGRVTAAPKSGQINWSQFGEVTDAKKEQIKSDIANILVMNFQDKELVNQKAIEVKNKKEIKNQEVKLTNKIKELENVNKLDKESKLKLQLEINKEKDILYSLKDEEKNINNLNTLFENVNSSVGRNALFQKFFDEGIFTGRDVGLLLTTVKNQDIGRQTAILKGIEINKNDQVDNYNRLKIYNDKFDKASLDTLYKPTSDPSLTYKTMHTSIFEEIKNEYLKDFNVPGSEDMTIKEIRNIIAQDLNTTKDQIKQIDAVKKELSLNIANNRTNEERKSFASNVNADVLGRQRFEELTGLKIVDLESQGMSPDTALRNYLEGSIGSDNIIMDDSEIKPKLESTALKNQRLVVENIKENNTIFYKENLKLKELEDKELKLNEFIRDNPIYRDAPIGYYELYKGEPLTDIQIKEDNARSSYLQKPETPLLSSKPTKFSYTFIDEYDNIRSANVDNWKGNWLYNQGKDLTRGSTEIDLLLNKGYDEEIRYTIQGQKTALDEFGEWGNAADYISDTLGAWEKETRNYYKSNYSEVIVDGQLSNINVRDSEVSETMFGTSEPEGESFYDSAADEIGIRYDNERYASQDIGKALKKSDSYINDLRYQRKIVKNELDELEKQKIILQASHDSLRPQIEEKVKANVRDATIDEDFARKLNKSSQDLYDLNYKMADARVREKNYEKSIIKTEEGMIEAKKLKKQYDFNTISNNNISPRSTPSYGSPKPYGLTMSQKYPDTRTDVIQRTRGNNFKRIKSLGGIVR